jgi:hypothetical protein
MKLVAKWWLILDPPTLEGTITAAQEESRRIRPSDHAPEVPKALELLYSLRMTILTQRSGQQQMRFST